MTATAEVLPWLPDAWLEGINAGEYKERSRSKSNRSEVNDWILARPDARGKPCSVMQESLDAGLANLEESSSGAAHDELTSRTYHLVSLAAEGHRGLRTALNAVRRAFVAEVAQRRKAAALAGESAGTVRSDDEARREVGRAVGGAVRLLIGSLNEPEMVEAGLQDGASMCSCWDVPEGESSRAKDPFSYELTDIGNAEQLIDMVDGELLWCEGLNGWMGWDADRGLWIRHDADYGMQMARRIAPRVKAAAEQRFAAAESANTAAGRGGKSDAEILLSQANKLLRWSEQCGRVGALKAMLTVAQSYPEMNRRAEDFDHNPRLLGVEGGEVIELTDEGAVARKATREDRLTKSTGVPYVPGAQDPAWSSYLDTFVPDEELRWWLQRLFGYALLGGNPRRTLVFLHGPTSSGKSTIVEAASSAVGAYGGSFGLTIFRESQDERPRPDLVRVLGQRIVFASEAGSEWYLHADQLKRITGGDSITARQPYARTYIEAVPQFTPFVATNAVPRIPGADAALWRRLVAVPFDHQVFGEADDASARDHLRKDPGARQAVLNWLVDGWTGYCTEGLDDIPHAVALRTMEFREDVSDFHMWFAECCETGPADEYWVESGELFSSYQLWAATNSVDISKVTSHSFGRSITAQGIAKASQKWIDGENKRVRFGVRLKGSRR